MQAMNMFDTSSVQQPMTTYQSVVQAPTMFASNLPGMNVQLQNPNLGVIPGNQQTSVWQGNAPGIVSGVYGGQETSLVAQPFAGLVPGMQVMTQQPGGQLVPGIVGSQNQVLLNQSVIAQTPSIVPMGQPHCL